MTERFVGPNVSTRYRPRRVFTSDHLRRARSRAYKFIDSPSARSQRNMLQQNDFLARDCVSRA